MQWKRVQVHPLPLARQQHHRHHHHHQLIAPTKRWILIRIHLTTITRVRSPHPSQSVESTIAKLLRATMFYIRGFFSRRRTPQIGIVRIALITGHNQMCTLGTASGSRATMQGSVLCELFGGTTTVMHIKTLLSTIFTAASRRYQ